jgi:hypothetical protein
MSCSFYRQKGTTWSNGADCINTKSESNAWTYFIHVTRNAQYSSVFDSDNGTSRVQNENQNKNNPCSRAHAEYLIVTNMVKKLTPCMGPECSLLCSQKSAATPCL